MLTSVEVDEILRCDIGNSNKRTLQTCTADDDDPRQTELDVVSHFQKFGKF